MKQPSRGTMRAPIVRAVANIAAIAGCYAMIVAATYGATHIFRCHLFFGSQPGGCQEHPFVFGAIAICGAVLGMIIALALRARFAAYWCAVLSVFNTVGTVWYLRSGIADLPRYGATQSAMLMAATLGVVLASIVRETPWTETDHGPLHRVGHTVGTSPSFLNRHSITAYLIAGTISFAMADSLIRMSDRPLIADNVNHYAVFWSAMLAAILAGLIGRYGSRKWRSSPSSLFLPLGDAGSRTRGLL
jgi:hypothetical protein